MAMTVFPLKAGARTVGLGSEIDNERADTAGIAVTCPMCNALEQAGVLGHELFQKYCVRCCGGSASSVTIVPPQQGHS